LKIFVLEVIPVPSISKAIYRQELRELLHCQHISDTDQSRLPKKWESIDCANAHVKIAIIILEKKFLLFS
jgi:hypothetical protein